MKTWEVFKALTENTNLKAKRLSDGHIISMQKVDIQKGPWLSPAYKDCFQWQPSKKPLAIDDEWELIREPVPWQEAIQAWIEGTNPYSVRIDMGTYEVSLGGLLVGRLDYSISSVQEAFTNGKWYIEE